MNSRTDSFLFKNVKHLTEKMRQVNNYQYTVYNIYLTQKSIEWYYILFRDRLTFVNLL